MSETKTVQHTPGPWIYEYDEGKAYGEILTLDYSQIIASVDESRALDCYRDARGKANGRLIAAAPDLLEALSECITEDGAASIESKRLDYAVRRLLTITEIARAAIAKAKGETA